MHFQLLGGALRAPMVLLTSHCLHTFSPRGVWSPSRPARAGTHVECSSSSSKSDSRPPAGGKLAPAAVAAASVAALLVAGPALALDIHVEPANALSLPTWAIHTSSVIEWVTAMGLM